MSFDAIDERIVTTAAGPVAVSRAAHADGSLSIVGWLLPAGRRVGHARWRRGQPVSVSVAPELAATDFGERLAALIRDATATPAMAPAPSPPAPNRSDLLGWQWLLAELGEHRSLEELAVAAEP
jgi:hypothetical protein